MVSSGFLWLPEFKPLTHTVIENGMYILCNGNSIYVRVHPESNPLLLQDLFGEHIKSVDDIDPLLDSFPELGCKNMGKRMVGSDNSPEAILGNSPGVKNEEMPEVKNEEMPEVKNEEMPEVKNEEMPEVKNEEMEWYDNAHRAVEKLYKSDLSTEDILINSLR